MTAAPSPVLAASEDISPETADFLPQETLAPDDAVGSRYSWYVLSVLVLVYVFNFVDRQILAILAEDIKADLGLSDTQLGFLYGTAFAIFYGLFGIPLGRLADMWFRGRLMAMGLALWSSMTAASGLAGSFGQLAAARVGVGVGEASASPCAYSLISDWFPRERRALALAIYSSGLYLGSGLSLFIGGGIVKWWNAAFPAGTAPLGLAGWQAAFIIVGAPGGLLALWVASLREPIRGQADREFSPREPHPWAKFWQELKSVIPPLTLWCLWQLGGPKAALRNLVALLACGLGGWGLAHGISSNTLAPDMDAAAIAKVYSSDLTQWLAVAVGLYAVLSWSQAIKLRDPPSYALIWGSKAFLCLVVAGGLTALVNYSLSFWAVSHAMRTFAVDKADFGFIYGGMAAATAALGAVFGGWMGDKARRWRPWGRVLVMSLSSVGVAPFAIPMFMTHDLTLFYILSAPVNFLTAAWLGSAAATSQDLVLPRMRGAAGASFFLGTTLIGLALGPYAVGKISATTGSLQFALLCLFALVPVIAGVLWLLARLLPQAEATRIARARAAGETLLT